MKVLLALVILFMVSVEISLVHSHRKLPEYLRECYTNSNKFASPLPLNLQTILDIIRKVERLTNASLSMRTLSTSLIKRFKLDGIVYSKDLPEDEGVLRFSVSGAQHDKHLIVDELIPSNINSFPEVLLTHNERCTLHFAISNTIWDYYDETDQMFCKFKPNESAFDMFERTNNVRCLKEGGVILTPYGTVALGTVLAGIAAALQPQVVETKRLLKIRIADKNDEVIPPRKMDTKGSLLRTSLSSERIDNTWLATVAGELAEMAVYQGPIYDDQMFIGATGFWDRTMRPHFYYIMHPYENFDLTRAETVGAIDGLIIAKNLHSWTRKFENLRLSQVLDMYYSESGAFFNKNVNVCERGEQFLRIAPRNTLQDQTYAAAQLLMYQNSIATMSDAILQQMVNRSINHFMQYTSEHLFTQIHCRSPLKQQMRVEVIFAFDGSWTRVYTSDFLAALVDDLNVSTYGSKMGIIHGENGKWLLNVTNSPSNVHTAINNLSKIKWPSGVNLSEVFKSILTYLDDRWENNFNKNIIGNYGQAIVFLIPRIKLTNKEVKLALIALNKIKTKHPEVNFIYYICESKAELLNPFIITNEDQIITTLNINDISRILSTVPMILRSKEPNIHTIKGTLQNKYSEGVFKTYVSPLESISYRLHSQWRDKAKKFAIQLKGLGYGELKVCCWNPDTSNRNEIVTYCKYLSLNGQISLSDDVCNNDGSKWPDMYCQVQNISTVMICTENDCKSPDQVKYTISAENIQCSSSDK
ncbi:PREDICTED: uncharacterized protein LOC105365273, partial [Ceratosolen solmsi marchali]|uniref:Uncharacterized protein LOC105365273 n=1 Tax=Ceratosolen solmsi marchali TaxID=326594 RepID=A0AAJ7DZ34_9HYME